MNLNITKSLISGKLIIIIIISRLLGSIITMPCRISIEFLMLIIRAFFFIILISLILVNIIHIIHINYLFFIAIIWLINKCVYPRWLLINCRLCWLIIRIFRIYNGVGAKTLLGSLTTKFVFFHF